MLNISDVAIALSPATITYAELHYMCMYSTLILYRATYTYVRNRDCLGCVVLLCFVVCLTLLASSFLPSFLPSHLSNMF